MEEQDKKQEGEFTLLVNIKSLQQFQSSSQKNEDQDDYFLVEEKQQPINLKHQSCEQKSQNYFDEQSQAQTLISTINQEVSCNQFLNNQKQLTNIGIKHQNSDIQPFFIELNNNTQKIQDKIQDEVVLEAHDPKSAVMNFQQKLEQQQMIIQTDEENQKVNDQKQKQEKEQSQFNLIQIKSPKRRNIRLIIIFFLILCLLLATGIGLYYYLTSSTSSSSLNSKAIENQDEKLNFIEFQYKVNKTQSFSVKSKTQQKVVQKDGQLFIKETIVEHKFVVYCQYLTAEEFVLLGYVDETKSYEVGKENEQQYLPGVKDFLKTQNRLLDIIENNQGQLNYTTQNVNSTNSEDQSGEDGDDYEQSEDNPISKEIYDISRAELIQFNITKFGEIKEISFPINVDQNFLFQIPAIIKALTPTVLKSNYNVIKDASGKTRILQSAKNVTGRNVDGEYVMDQMEKHETEEGGTKLVQSYQQTTNSTYSQATESSSSTSFNKEGYLTKAEINSSQKIGDGGDKDDLFNSMEVKQSLTIDFLKEETISDAEYSNILDVYNLMGQIQVKWNDFFIILDQLRESDLQSEEPSNQDQEENLVNKKQKVDLTNQPPKRILDINDDTVQNMQIQIFSKNILTIPMKSFISFLCQKPKSNGENDKCKTQVFLSFLSTNIPISPVQEVNFPMTNFKNGVNWLKKSAFIIINKVNNTIINEIKEVEQLLNDKIQSVESILSKLNNPLLDDLDEFVETITSGLFSKVQNVEVRLKQEYQFLKDLMNSLISTLQDSMLSKVQDKINVIKYLLPEIQQQIESEVQRIDDLLLNQKDKLNDEVKNEISNLILSVEEVKERVLEEAINKFQNSIIDSFQNRIVSLIDTFIDYFTSQLSFIDDKKNQITQEIKNKLNSIIKKSLTQILTKPLTTLADNLLETLTNTNQIIQQNVEETKQQVDQQILLINQKVNQLDTKAVETSQELLDQLKDRQQYYSDMIDKYSIELDPQELLLKIEENIQLINYTLQEGIQNTVKNISIEFTNFIQVMTTNLEDILLQLKGKAKDLSQNIVKTIQKHVDNVFSKLDGFKQILEKKINFFYKLLLVDFNSQDVVKSIKDKLGKEYEEIEDDQKENQPNSLKMRNLSEDNLLDFSILSKVGEIKDVIESGIQKVQESVKLVDNLKNNFNEFSLRINSVFSIPFDFTEYLQMDLKLDDELEEFLNGEEILNIFKDSIANIKSEFLQFVKSEIVETIQESGINLIRDQFKNIGNKFLQQILANPLAKLLDTDKLLEIALTKISSLFKINKSIQLFKKHLQVPEQPDPFIIPTPIGVPLVLSYYFVFDAEINLYLGIQGFQVSVGFDIKTGAAFEASAALSILIAEAGVYARGTLVQADLIARLNMQIYPKFQGLFKVDAKFKAFSLQAAVYIQYIKIKIEIKCYQILKRNRLLRKFRRFRRALGRVRRSFRSARRFIGKYLKVQICIPIPIISKSDKINIFPPLNINGPEFNTQLALIKLG